MLTISLVIPAYNEEKFLARCLDEVRRHSDTRFKEIIVVNNGSTDSTAVIAARYPEVTLVEESRRGTGWARERGWRTATGDIIAFIDADTRLPNGWVERVLQSFAADPKLVCLSGPYSYYDLAWFPRLLSKIYLVLAWLTYHATGYLAIFGNTAVRRHTLEQMNGINTSILFYGDDTDLARRASKFGRVKFDFKLVMPTSARRFRSHGLFRTGWLYTINFFAEVLWHRPTTAGLDDIR